MASRSDRKVGRGKRMWFVVFIHTRISRNDYITWSISSPTSSNNVIRRYVRAIEAKSKSSGRFNCLDLDRPERNSKPSPSIVNPVCQPRWKKFGSIQLTWTHFNEDYQKHFIR